MSFDASVSSINTSDPHARFLSTSCLDFLLIELVPMAERLTRELALNDKALDDDEIRESTFFRLESIGYRVGQGLAERFSRDRPRFTDNLDVIKFLCKDLWTILFKKQVDNLKTNHRGVYVLTDNSFRPFARMSMASRSEATAMAQAVGNTPISTFIVILTFGHDPSSSGFHVASFEVLYRTWALPPLYKLKRLSFPGRRSKSKRFSQGPESWGR
ncbi:hypothetical protein KXX33_002462 [Aspergillus fumigatus]|uniref:Uncharacterized protein n=1 Tax=Aspergillus fumigatus TaxID=746128 RepID=A0A229Y410_ASPFM|nr:hypothetical protein KXX30_002823 [Aspergillus fumigatus]KMK55071.1 BET3 family protein [Aspergillus fumigatus Z5]KAH1308889.1 hypothetical protein KXX66_001279 [Aspergillus fumigatus]KAH1324032.1 hypothetical protein KXX47_000599 [Aspergillus fumigatus]KAH1347102.1 hypothetical protein KXX33_002462 [Aspergillus fumigatus]